MNKSLSIIMPAYMESQNLENAFKSAVRSMENISIIDYEIIIITNLRRDGSHDGTPDIADRIMKNNSRVRHIHNKAYVGLGYKYWQGVKNAAKNYVIMIPGDNETEESSIVYIANYLGEAECIVSYTSNQKVRALKRRVVSYGFTVLCNIFFGMRMKYYNGLCIHPSEFLKKIPLKSENFAYMAAALIYLVKSGVSYKEVPIEIKPITNKSSAFKLKSVFECLGTLAVLFWQVQVLRKRIKIN